MWRTVTLFAAIILVSEEYNITHLQKKIPGPEISHSIKDYITRSISASLIIRQTQNFTGEKCPDLRDMSFKVAEHSFSARFCWCKLARAQGFQKTNMPSTERSFYLLLNTRTICVIFRYNCMQCIDGSSILLHRYVTRSNDAKNPAFLAFVCYRKNPVKCNACAIARKIETDCFSRNVPFSSDPVVRISRNLAKK